MKLSTLKQLIKNLGESAKDKDELLINIINLIELYEKDNLENDKPVFPTPTKPYENPYQRRIEDRICDTKVTFGDLCPCNPKYGGSGVCNCSMGNELVNKEYQTYHYYITTTDNINEK
jgi:hypothetical protein